ncbi:MAG: hypothetical protein K0S76_2140 [Herbinix sp.]|nr:hypothetical protein [Herbinix sp.]
MTRTVNMMTKRNKYRRGVNNRTLMVAIILFVAIIICSAVFFSKTVTAERNSARTKQITSVEIHRGDSLWSIASEYITDEYSNLNDYIEEIKDSNGLISDTIHVGNYIIIPYYADAVVTR